MSTWIPYLRGATALSHSPAWGPASNLCEGTCGTRRDELSEWWNFHRATHTWWGSKCIHFTPIYIPLACSRPSVFVQGIQRWCRNSPWLWRNLDLMGEAKTEAESEWSEIRAPITFLEATGRVNLSLEQVRVGFFLKCDPCSPQVSFILMSQVRICENTRQRREMHKMLVLFCFSWESPSALLKV